MRYMTIRMDSKGNQFGTEHRSSRVAVLDAMDKWIRLSDAERKYDRIMAVTVRDNYSEDVGNGSLESDFVDILWDSTDGEVWATRDRGTGEVIDLFPSREDADSRLEEYEEEDRREGTYEPNFYEAVRLDNLTSERD